MNINDESSWKKSFFEDNFSVDSCLSKYTQKSDLETLRRELKNYGVDLQNQMSDILKTETEAIVNLAEYLTNLNYKIDNLSGPICQLREEILTLYHLIKTAENSYRAMLDDLKNNNTKRNNIHLKLGMIESSICITNLLRNASDSADELTVLERLVVKFSFEKNYMDELGILSDESNGFIKNMEDSLVEKVNNTFLESFKDVNVEHLTRCLRMYDNLRKQSEAERVFQLKIVKPYIERIFTESNLEKHQQDLEQLYSEVLAFIDNDMKILYHILLKNPDLIGYNFIYNSFWKEFDRQARDGLPNITAPGNPDLFQKRYKTTWIVLQRIALSCGNENLVISDESFQSHLKRFNLPVYFEIQYQKIAGAFESTISSDNSQFYETDTPVKNKLKLTQSLLDSITRCYQDDIYLDQLADQFLKLTMMLLSRYLMWFLSMLENNALFTQTNEWEDFVMNSLWDFEIVENFVAPKCENTSNIETTIFRIMNTNLWPLLTMKFFRLNKNSIETVQNKLKTHLIGIISQECLTLLQNVEAIPRLYRRTNRSAPKEPSLYMSEGLIPILDFHRRFSGFLESQMRDVLDNVIVSVATRYLNMVKDVLNSVCKTNESLRRLKNRNVGSSEESSPRDAMSDENKIRLQIKFDVEYFLERLYPLSSVKGVELMDALKEEITSSD